MLFVFSAENNQNISLSFWYPSNGDFRLLSFVYGLLSVYTCSFIRFKLDGLSERNSPVLTWRLCELWSWYECHYFRMH